MPDPVNQSPVSASFLRNGLNDTYGAYSWKKLAQDPDDKLPPLSPVAVPPSHYRPLQLNRPKPIDIVYDDSAEFTLDKRLQEFQQGGATKIITAIPSLLLELPFISEILLYAMATPGYAIRAMKVPERVHLSIYPDQAHMLEEYALLKSDVCVKLMPQKLNTVEQVEAAFAQVRKAEGMCVRNKGYTDQVAVVFNKIHDSLSEQWWSLKSRENPAACIDTKSTWTRSLDQPNPSTIPEGVNRLDMTFRFAGSRVQILSSENGGQVMGYQFDIYGGKHQMRAGLDPAFAKEAKILLDRYYTITPLTPALSAKLDQVNRYLTAHLTESFSESKNRLTLNVSGRRLNFTGADGAAIWAIDFAKGEFTPDELQATQAYFRQMNQKGIVYARIDSALKARKRIVGARKELADARHKYGVNSVGAKKKQQQVDFLIRMLADETAFVEGNGRFTGTSSSDALYTDRKLIDRAFQFKVTEPGMFKSETDKIAVQGSVLTFTDGWAPSRTINLRDSHLTTEDYSEFIEQLQGLRGNLPGGKGQVDLLIKELQQVGENTARVIINDVPFAQPVSVENLQRQARSSGDLLTPRLRSELENLPHGNHGEVATVSLKDRDIYLQKFDANGNKMIDLSELRDSEALVQLFRLRHDINKRPAFVESLQLLSVDARRVFEFIDRNNNDARFKEPETLRDWQELQIQLDGLTPSFDDDRKNLEQEIPGFLEVLSPFLSADVAGLFTDSGYAPKNHRPVSGPSIGFKTGSLYGGLQTVGDASAASRPSEAALNPLFRAFTGAPIATVGSIPAPSRELPAKSATRADFHFSSDFSEKSGINFSGDDEQVYIDLVNNRELRIFLWDNGMLSSNQEVIMDLDSPYWADGQDINRAKVAREIIKKYKECVLNQDGEEIPLKGLPPASSEKAKTLQEIESRLNNYLASRAKRFDQNPSLGHWVLQSRNQYLCIKTDDAGEVQSVRAYDHSNPNAGVTVYLQGRFVRPQDEAKLNRFLQDFERTGCNNPEYISNIRQALAKLHGWHTVRDEKSNLNYRCRNISFSSGNGVRVEIAHEFKGDRYLTHARLISTQGGQTGIQDGELMDVRFTLGDGPLEPQKMKHIGSIMTQWWKGGLHGEDAVAYRELYEKLNANQKANKAGASDAFRASILGDPLQEAFTLKQEADAQRSAGALINAGRLSLIAAQLLLNDGDREVLPKNSSWLPEAIDAAGRAKADFQQLFNAKQGGDDQARRFLLNAVFTAGVLHALNGDAPSVDACVEELRRIDPAQVNVDQLKSLTSFARVGGSSAGDRRALGALMKNLMLHPFDETNLASGMVPGVNLPALNPDDLDNEDFKARTLRPQDLNLNAAFDLRGHFSNDAGIRLNLLTELRNLPVAPHEVSENLLLRTVSHIHNRIKAGFQEETEESGLIADLLAPQTGKSNKSLAEEAILILQTRGGGVDYDQQNQIDLLKQELEEEFLPRLETKYGESSPTTDLVAFGLRYYGVSSKDIGSRYAALVDDQWVWRDGQKQAVWEEISKKQSREYEAVLRTAGVASPFGEFGPELSQQVLDLDAVLTKQGLVGQQKALSVFQQVAGSNLKDDRRLFRAFQALNVLMQNGKLNCPPQFFLEYDPDETKAPKLGLGVWVNLQGQLTLLALEEHDGQSQLRGLSVAQAISYYFVGQGERDLQGKRFDAARNNFRLSREIDPLNIDGLYNLTRSYIEESVPAARTAALLELDTVAGEQSVLKNHVAFLKGTVLLAEGRKQLAEAELAKIPAGDPLLQKWQKVAAASVQGGNQTLSDIRRQSPSNVPAVETDFENYMDTLALTNRESARNFQASLQGMYDYTPQLHLLMHARQSVANWFRKDRQRRSGSEKKTSFTEPFVFSPAALLGVTAEEITRLGDSLQKDGWGVTYCVRQIRLGEAQTLTDSLNDKIFSMELTPIGDQNGEKIYFDMLFENHLELQKRRAGAYETITNWQLGDDKNQALSFVLAERNDPKSWLRAIELDLGKDKTLDNFVVVRKLQSWVDQNPSLVELRQVIEQLRNLFSDSEVRAHLNEKGALLSDPNETLGDQLIGKLAEAGTTSDPAQVLVSALDLLKLCVCEEQPLDVVRQFNDSTAPQGLFEKSVAYGVKGLLTRAKHDELSSRAAEAIDNLEEAVTKGGELLQQSPLAPTIFLDLAGFYQKTGQPAKALDRQKAALDVLLPIATNGGRISDLAAKNFRELGNLLVDLAMNTNGFAAESEKVFSELQKTLKNPPSGSFIKSLSAYREMQKTLTPPRAMDLAQLCYQAATYLNPKDAESLLGLATVSRSLGRKDQAIVLMNRILSTEGMLDESERASTLIQLGDAELEIGRVQDAAEHFYDAMSAPQGRDRETALSRYLCAYQLLGEKDKTRMTEGMRRLASIDHRYFTPAMLRTQSLYRVIYGWNAGDRSLEELQKSSAEAVRLEGASLPLRDRLIGLKSISSPQDLSIIREIIEMIYANPEAMENPESKSILQNLHLILINLGNAVQAMGQVEDLPFAIDIFDLALSAKDWKIHRLLNHQALSIHDQDENETRIEIPKMPNYNLWEILRKRNDGKFTQSIHVQALRITRALSAMKTDGDGKALARAYLINETLVAVPEQVIEKSVSQLADSAFQLRQAQTERNILGAKWEVLSQSAESFKKNPQRTESIVALVQSVDDYIAVRLPFTPGVLLLDESQIPERSKRLKIREAQNALRHKAQEVLEALGKGNQETIGAAVKKLERALAQLTKLSTPQGVDADGVLKNALEVLRAKRAVATAPDTSLEIERQIAALETGTPASEAEKTGGAPTAEVNLNIAKSDAATTAMGCQALFEYINLILTKDLNVSYSRSKNDKLAERAEKAERRSFGTVSVRQRMLVEKRKQAGNDLALDGLLLIFDTKLAMRAPASKKEFQPNSQEANLLRSAGKDLTIEQVLSHKFRAANGEARVAFGGNRANFFGAVDLFTVYSFERWVEALAMTDEEAGSGAQREDMIRAWQQDLEHMRQLLNDEARTLKKGLSGVEAATSSQRKAQEYDRESLWKNERSLVMIAWMETVVRELTPDRIRRMKSKIRQDVMRMSRGN